MTDTETMAIELFGGPADGMRIDVPVNAKVWIATAPQMTPAEFIALETGGRTPESAFPAADHIYAWTKNFSVGSLRRIFHYTGPKHRP